jgi:NADPH:quinone reductase-like Zn-dependent oxidoreductase
MSTRAVQIDQPGGLEVLTLREVPPPTVGSGQVLVRTVASSLNPIDRKMRARKTLTFPVTLGWDVAGIVLESDAVGYHAGDRVIAMTDPVDTPIGAWTDLLALDGDQLAHAPTTVSLSQAATIPLVGLTGLQAWGTLVVSPGDRVLVTGAAGAIGGFVVQFAVNAGIRVDGLVSRSAHIDAAKILGAELVTTDPAALPTGSYDAIVDTVALPSKGVDVRALVNEKGQYVATGKDDSQIPGGHAIRVRQDPEGLAGLVRMVDAGTLKLRIAAHYGLLEFREAHEHVEAGGLLGKVVLEF